MMRLRFLKGHHQGLVLDFTPPRTLVLGRSAYVDVQIYDERISRRHCAIRLEPTSVRVKDLGSGNGTYLNGAEIREAALTHGDRLQLGQTEIQISLANAPQAATLPRPSVAAAQTLPRETHANSATRAHPPPPAPNGPSAVCAFCGAVIPPAEVPLATQHRGRYLCNTCSPRIEVPGYTIERTLGEGAMGVVYLVRNARGEQRALKVLKTRGDMTDEDRARFVREVTTAAQLEHPNIVRVLDYGQAGPFLYYVMEFVPGKTLRDWLETHGRLPLASALRVAVQVAEALEHARQRHIVHRDIKPENIMVQGDGHAKLADFGLAKNTMTSGASGLTRPGDGLGTLPYMPPEQIESALYADHRCDVYSFGATIYHMLTGQAPFNARTPLEYFKLIRTQKPQPVAEFRNDIPRVICVMLEKSLAKRPEERYATVGEMQRIMRQFMQEEFDSRQTAT